MGSHDLSFVKTLLQTTDAGNVDPASALNLPQIIECLPCLLINLLRKLVIICRLEELTEDGNPLIGIRKKNLLEVSLG